MQSQILANSHKGLTSRILINCNSVEPQHLIRVAREYQEHDTPSPQIIEILRAPLYGSLNMCLKVVVFRIAINSGQIGCSVVYALVILSLIVKTV